MSSIVVPDRLYFRIGDVADLLGVRPHVLRYWESEFPIVTPQKSSTGQRVYRRSDVETLVMIKRLLHDERYSIEGARKRIRDLRREGALKSFKQGAVSSEATNGATRETLAELARSVTELARLPLSDLFHY
jgi:DNA-binding transcriptional MerR regulator